MLMLLPATMLSRNDEPDPSSMSEASIDLQQQSLHHQSAPAPHPDQSHPPISAAAHTPRTPPYTSSRNSYYIHAYSSTRRIGYTGSPSGRTLRSILGQLSPRAKEALRLPMAGENDPRLLPKVPTGCRQSPSITQFTLRLGQMSNASWAWVALERR